MTDEAREGPGTGDLKPTSSVVLPVSKVAPAESPRIVGSTIPARVAAPEGQPARTLRTPEAKGSRLTVRLQNAIDRWVPQAQYQLMGLGSAGVAGATATAAAAIIAAVALLSLRAANENLSSQIILAQHRPAPAATPEQGLIRVVAQLPSRSQMPAVLGQVLQQARAAGVELAKGQYTYVAPTAAGIGRYELDFPVTAQYPALRDFINRTLTNIPAAGLDKLSIERKVVADTQVNADVRFVIFIRDR
jgi:hypothetical protein